MKNHTNNHTKNNTKNNKLSHRQIKKSFISLKELFKKHKNIILPTAISLISLLTIIIFCIAWSIKTKEINPLQDYYINIVSEDDMTIDCNLSELDGVLTCTNKEIFGTFSDYDSVELIGATSDGNTFKIDFSYSIPKDSYETADFNLNDFPNSKEVTHLIGLRDKLLDKTILSKEIKVTYRFSENDKKLISDAHAKWQENENQKQAETESQNQTTTTTNNSIKQEETSPEQKAPEEPTATNPETEFPAELENRALDSCYRKFYKETSLYISKHNSVNNYWSGEPYNQIIVINDLAQSFRVVCKYNWGAKMAISIDLEY